jgi:hypothetical protein
MYSSIDRIKKSVKGLISEFDVPEILSAYEIRPPVYSKNY